MGGRLDGQVALITAGAGAGIGRATVRAFVDDGATVVVTDRSGKRLVQLADEDWMAGPHIVREMDARDEDAIGTLVDEVADTFGHLDVLANSVGFTRAARLTDMDLDTWREVVDICLTSHFLHLRAVLPLMTEAGRGSVVNISSIAAWSPTALGEAHYAAAKAGVLGLTRAAAAEAADAGVRVNAVAPGLIWNEHLSRGVPQEYLDAYRARSLMSRQGTPEDVARVILFLASDDSRHITGDVLTVAGGHVSRH